MRTYRQILRELEEAEALSSAANLGPSLDNDGRVAYTADERRAMYARRAERLRKEKADFERFLKKGGLL